MPVTENQSGRRDHLPLGFPALQGTAPAIINRQLHRPSAQALHRLKASKGPLNELVWSAVPSSARGFAVAPCLEEKPGTPIRRPTTLLHGLCLHRGRLVSKAYACYAPTQSLASLSPRTMLIGPTRAPADERHCSETVVPDFWCGHLSYGARAFRARRRAGKEGGGARGAATSQRSQRSL